MWEEEDSATQNQSPLAALLTDATPIELFTTRTSGILITVHKTSGARAVYFYEPGAQKLEKIAQAEILSVFRQGESDSFVVAWQTPGGPEYLLVNALGRHTKEASFPSKSLAPDNWFDCNASGQYLVCGTDRPDMTPDSDDYNPLGVTAALVVELASGKSRIFPLPSPTSYLSYSPAVSRIYASSALNENAPSTTVTIFNMGGTVLKTVKGWKGTKFSSQQNFALPFLHEGALDWEVYDTRTWKPLMAVHTGNSGEYSYYQEWNPVRESLLSAERRSAEGTDKEQDYLEVFDVRTGVRVFSLPEKKNQAFVCSWSRDGKNLVALDSGELKFMPVP